IVILVPIWRASAEQHVFRDIPHFQQLSQMNDALTFLARLNPQPRVLVMDQQSAAMMKYYLCRGIMEGYRDVPPDFMNFSCLGYQIMELHDWIVSDDVAIDKLMKAERPADLKESPIWIIHFAPNPDWNELAATDRQAQFGKIYFRRVY